MSEILPLGGWLNMDGGRITGVNLVIEGEDGRYTIEGDATYTENPVVEPPAPRWTFPIGTVEYPPEAWYAASRHRDYNTNIWSGGYHTGIDYNLDRAPYGDVELGFPTYAITDGVIHGTWHSESNLGSIVYRIEHNGAPLWVRHWHQNRDSVFLSWQPGDVVKAGDVIGHVGDYPPGPRQGAHLHFDMCLGAFHPGVWWTATTGGDEPGPEWIDPVEVLKAHLDADLVEMSLKRGDG